MPKPNRKPDRRVRRTRRQLQNALRELIKQKPYNKITKVDIVNEADISRATFYLHYGSVEELLVQCFSSLGDDVAEHLEESKKSYITLPVLTRMMFDSVLSNRALYKELQETTALSTVMNQQVQVMIPIIQNTLAATIPQDLNDIVTYQIAGALSASALWWIDHNFSPSAKKITTTTLEHLRTTLPTIIP